MVPELLFTCPVCFAPIGKPCNAPTETGRRDVRWFHHLREDRAAQMRNIDSPCD